MHREKPTKTDTTLREKPREKSQEKMEHNNVLFFSELDVF
jgi:hypothetical protein